MEKKNGGCSNSSKSSLSDGVGVIQQTAPYSEVSVIPCDTSGVKSEAWVVVGGYKVKRELGPLVRAIFRKHGDIVKGSTFSMESRWCLLELVCTIYNNLEASSITEMTPLELKSIYNQIRDLGRVKVKVGWLQDRLNWISKNIEMYRAAKASAGALLREKEKEVETCEKQLEELKAVEKKLGERLEKAKDEQCAAHCVVDRLDKFKALSLVHDLV